MSESIQQVTEALQARISEMKGKIAASMAERQNYLVVASEIEAVYNRMDDEKSMMLLYEHNVNVLAEEDFADFKGDLHSNRYRNNARQLVDSYDKVIRNIDKNMDNLWLLRSSYLSNATNLGGIIGDLQTRVSELVAQVQNRFN